MRTAIRFFLSSARPAVLVMAASLLATSCSKPPPAVCPADAPLAAPAAAPSALHEAPAAPLPSPTLPAATETLVARMWHGRTKAAKADEYTRYLNEAGLPKIRAIPGNRGVQMIRRIDRDAADFYVISYWTSREAIRAFAGDDIEKTHHMPRDPEFLLELEPTVKHFDVLVNEWKRSP